MSIIENDYVFILDKKEILNLYQKSIKNSYHLLSIKFLDISTIELTKKDLQYLNLLFYYLKNLETITLFNTKINYEYFDIFLKNIKCLDKLENLSLNDNYLNDDLILNLILMVNELPQFKSITLSNNQVTFQGLIDILNNIEKNIVLQINDCNSKFILILINLLKKNSIYHDFDISYHNNILKFKRIKVKSYSFHKFFNFFYLYLINCFKKSLPKTEIDLLLNNVC